MIIVHSMEKFDCFVTQAISSQTPYKIIGSEEDSPYLIPIQSTEINIFKFTYVLCSPLFEVVYSDVVNINDKAKITQISRNYDIVKFKNIFVKNGNIHCE